MLGELIAEDRGKITTVRVLPNQGQDPQMEVCFQSTGKLLGIDTTETGTYCSVLTAGICRGTGQGIITTKDGDIVTWTGQGVGKPKGKGMAASWRGAIYCQTTCQKLANLNGMAIIFEHEVDEAGNVHSKLYEWK